MKKNILIIGSGAREHVIGWKLLQSGDVGRLYFAPGNGGTRSIGENISIGLADCEGLLRFAKDKAIDLTIVGSEAPLEAGLVDIFTQNGLKVFGPTRGAARLETSKAWASDFMARHGLPCPKYRVFDVASEALSYVKKVKGDCVIKADGLCQGKGVFVCSTFPEAQTAIETLMVKKVFGKSGERVIIQEKLNGKEVSMMAFCDGERAVPLIAAQDYKRIYDGDLGSNTGGMGAVAPANRVRPTLFKKIHRLLTLAVDAMKEEGLPYTGILYAGIMVTESGVYILEFNCRFGDPETQVQLPLLESDLLAVVQACTEGRLDASLVRWQTGVAVCVVLASEGYPGTYLTGKTIQETGEVGGDVTVFHAGTALVKGSMQTHGGRVLSVVAIGSSLTVARESVYRYIKSSVSFDGMYYRKDIGA
jgi:phosphoribosylamine---glycine ligase